jgi:uncharacterized membrane protein YgdD (TMEM256/DUF423 family)
MKHRATLAWAGVLGATGVVAGSLGAHPLRATLEAAGALPAWQTATQFQLVHAAALLGFAGWLRVSEPPAWSARWASCLWVAGTVLFSGSLYLLALGAPRWLGHVTPFGGLALIAGWVLALAASFRA